MTGSSTTSETTVERTVPLATIATASFMHEHGLGDYIDIRAPRHGETSLVVFVPSYAFEAWPEAGFIVDETTSRPVSGDRLYEHVSADGRLPESGFRVRVECVRRIERPLTAVPA